MSSPSSEHLAEERRMLTAGLTSSICPFSFFLLRAHNRVEGTGVICVEKVDLIACDARKEALFFGRAWRAIRPSLIPAWGAIMMGGLSSQNTQMAICSGGSSPSFPWQILCQIYNPLFKRSQITLRKSQINTSVINLCCHFRCCVTRSRSLSVFRQRNDVTHKQEAIPRCSTVDTCLLKTLKF